MIYGNCRTNLDDYKHYEWPTVFVAVPLIGQYVRAINNRCSLKVVGVTHYVVDTHTEAGEQPRIEVELNK